MKKIVLACVCALMAISSIFAQDIIVTNDAKKIEAKILEVSKSEIRYKEQDNLDGPTFVLETNEISSIIYSNGKVVLYNQSNNSNVQANDSEVPSKVIEDAAYNGEIYLLSGIVVKGRLVKIEDNYVGYTLNDKYYTIPASQIAKVIDHRDNNIIYYDGQNLNQNDLQEETLANTNTTSKKYQATTKSTTPCFQSYLDLSGLFENIDGLPAGGIGLDGIDGVRINKYCFFGLGLGLYAEFANVRGATVATLQSPIFADFRVYIPNKARGFYPYFETSVGPLINYFQTASYMGYRAFGKSVSVYAFFRLNAGLDYNRFSLGIGYELWGDTEAISNFGFVKIGIRIGKDV